MAFYQVVEKEDFGTDWHQVRYEAYAMGRFDTEEKAIEAAKKYLTHVNCANSLTRDEVKKNAEAFMMIKNAGREECFMGVLDGDDWYMEDRNKEIVTKRNYFELEGKTEVAVKEVRGT